MKDFNFIPKEYLEKIEKKRQRYHIMVMMVVFAVFVIIISAIPIAINARLKVQKSDFERQVRDTAGYVEKQKQINIIENLYKQREEASNKISSYGMDVLKVYKVLGDNLPENVFLKNLSISKAESNNITVSASCVAKTEEDIASFVNSLRKQDYVLNLTIPGVLNLTTGKKESASKGCEFTVTILIKPGK